MEKGKEKRVFGQRLKTIGDISTQLFPHHYSIVTDPFSEKDGVPFK